MPVLALNDMTVRHLKRGLYLDRKTPSFGLRVGKRRKTWLVIDANRNKQKFGQYPDLSPADARAEAKRLLSQAPTLKPSAMTFADAKTAFLEANYADASPRTKHEVKRLLDTHFKPLDADSVADVTDGKIKTQLDRLAATPSEQLHAYRAVRCFLKWCTRPPRRFMPHSPMEGYEPPSKDKKGTHTLTDTEIKKVWNACEGERGAMVKLLFLWGTRNTETASIKRAWNEDGVITIPGTHTKNGRDHAIPLLPLAKQVLATLPENGPYYFPGRSDNDEPFNPGSWGKLKQEIVARSGVANWQLRDLRRTFRSNIARLKVPRDLAEVLINHAPAALDEIYDRYDRLSEKRNALRRYEQWLQTLLKI